MKKITFILGGARSGKSTYATRLAEESGKQVIYIATGEGKDREMKKRISLHKAERPGGWKTCEEPLRVAELIAKIDLTGAVVIIDCLTLLATNLMLKKQNAEQIEQEIRLIISLLKTKKARAIIVSNEVGLGIVPANRLARDFRDIAGSVNKAAAGLSDEVIFMVSGIPWKIK